VFGGFKSHLDSTIPWGQGAKKRVAVDANLFTHFAMSLYVKLKQTTSLPLKIGSTATRFFEVSNSVLEKVLKLRFGTT